jgi:hypothetical protein
LENKRRRDEDVENRTILVKLMLKEIRHEDMACIPLFHDMASSEHDIKTSGSIRDGEFLDRPSYCQLLKDSVSYATSWKEP